MTLVDSRPASRRTLERLASEHDHELDVASLMARYGLPLSQWLPSDCDQSLFWSLQASHLSSVEPMPGALAAVAAVRHAGSRVIVITAAHQEIAVGALEVAGLSVDGVHAGVWAESKVRPLREKRIVGRSSETTPTTWPRHMMRAHSRSAWRLGRARPPAQRSSSKT